MGDKMNYCVNCGNEAIEQHHIIPLALGGNDIASNKVYLCSKCHAIIHNMDINKRGTDWRRLQAAGIEKAKQTGKYKGKPPIEINWDLFKQLYPIWQRKEITATNMMKQLELKPNTFYRRVKEYEATLSKENK